MKIKDILNQKWQYARDVKTNIWHVYINIDTLDNDYETGELLYGMSAISICECADENTAKLIVLLPEMFQILDWVSPYFLESKLGGDVWCALRNVFGAQSWLKDFDRVLQRAKYLDGDIFNKNEKTNNH